MATEDDNQPEKKKGGTILGGLGVVGVLLFKFKVAIFAVLKFGWLAKSALSIFASIAIYAVFFGWPFAVAAVVVIIIHEGGHWIWMKALGLNPQAPMLLPFLGAYTVMSTMPPDGVTRAWVALAGPLVGGVAAAAMYWAGGQLNSGWLMAAGSFGFLLNLMQLIPAVPLDGGFVIRVISRWLLLPGAVLLCALALKFHWILFGIIGVVSLISVVKDLFNKEPKAPETATIPERFVVGFAYLALTGMLGYLFMLSQTTVMDVVRKDKRSHQLPAQLQQHTDKATDQETEKEVDQGTEPRAEHENEKTDSQSPQPAQPQ